MSREKALGPDPQKRYTYIELPIGASAIGMPSSYRKTGLWRYLKPSMRRLIPPCQDACPLGNWIQKFVAETGSENRDEAWKALILENPFPGVCGRVCYHPCELSCNRKELDAPTSIHATERYLADQFFHKRLTLPIRRERQNKKVAIVGSGPAGLAGAYFLCMLGYETVVYEACNELGGIPQMGIPRYRLPKEILDKEIEDILALGVEVQTGCRIGNDLQFADLLSHDAVLLATGAHRPAKMTIPTETSANVYQGLDFLAQYNLGQTLDLGKRVIVIGGGNVAIDVSRTLIRLGCTPVLLYRRTRNQMPAHDEEVCDAQEEGLECQYLLAPTSIGPSRQGGIILECNKMKLEGKGPDGRQQVVSLEGETETFEADQIILATGEVPDLSYLPDEVELAKGLLGVNEAGQTRIANVFGAGDMIDQPWTVAQAIGSAKRAAIAIDHYLRGDDLQAILNQGALAKTMRAHLGIEVSSKSDDQQIATYKDLNMTYSGTQPSHTSNKLPPAERSGSFDEVDPGLDEKAALEEAQRCLSCGVCRMCGNCNLFCPDGAVKLDSGGKRYVIDYDYCKGCGICFNECPVACIALDREGEG